MAEVTINEGTLILVAQVLKNNGLSESLDMSLAGEEIRRALEKLTEDKADQ